ncbi:MAG: hypothetical protein ABIR66_07145, partial [Saprospiraceae bacterium]
IRSFKTRSIDDLSQFWAKNQGSYNIVIFISHGCDNGFCYGINKECFELNEFVETLNIEGVSEKLIISLACNTGSEKFGNELIKHNFCNTFIGSDSQIHGAIASLFCQTFIANYIFEEKNIDLALEKGNCAIPGKDKFVLFRKNKNTKSATSLLSNTSPTNNNHITSSIYVTPSVASTPLLE